METYRYVVMRKCLYGYKYTNEQFADKEWLSVTGLDTDTAILSFESIIPNLTKHSPEIPYVLPDWEYVVMIPTLPHG